jgi:prepilin-type N-terminal cleavage/methylation domain-containing protein
MKQDLRTEEDLDRGFTLVELLVVMLIIGVLVAIAIPLFLGQRAKSRDVAVKSDLSNLGKEVEAYYVDYTAPPEVFAWEGRYYITNPGYPNTDAGRISDGVKFVGSFGQDPMVLEVRADNTDWTATDWCFALTDPNGSAKTFKFSAKNGLEPGTCASPTAP